MSMKSTLFIPSIQHKTLINYGFMLSYNDEREFNFMMVIAIGRYTATSLD